MILISGGSNPENQWLPFLDWLQLCKDLMELYLSGHSVATAKSDYGRFDAQRIAAGLYPPRTAEVWAGTC